MPSNQPLGPTIGDAAIALVATLVTIFFISIIVTATHH